MHPNTVSTSRADVAPRGLWLLVALLVCSGLAAQSWKRKGPPEGIRGPSAWDQARQRLVVVGNTDVWEWDGFTWARRGAPPKSTLWNPSVAYDPVTRRVLLFGGTDSSQSVYDDTWAWDGTEWILLDPAQRPPGRSSHVMVLDEARQRIVMFGGQGTPASGVIFGDTWEWDGVTWQRVATRGPRGRIDHAMAYDPVQGRVLLFGGDSGYGLGSFDLWGWDGQAWTLYPYGGTFPSQRWSAAMGWDAARQVMVVYGGVTWFNYGTVLGDHWEWDGATWTQISANAAPGPLSHSTLAWEPASGRLLLVNGRTWELSAGQFQLPWSLPPAEPNHGAAYDQARGETVLYSGDETWTWDGVDWVLRQPSSAPGPRSSPGMAYDAARGETVLFGGNMTQTDTWLWNGTAWTSRSAPGPTARSSGVVMAYDSARGRVVMFGGADATGRLDETWEWDGASWTWRPTAVTPPARTYAAMAYDPVRRRTVLFGGRGDLGLLQDTWEWDGASWTQSSPSVSPAPRVSASMAYDASLGAVVLTGAPQAPAPDTWAWDGTTWRQITTGGPGYFTTPHVEAVADARRGRLVAIDEAGGTWELGSMVAPTKSGLGAGCPGSSGQARLDTMGPAERGRRGFAFDLSNMRPASPGALLLGTTPSSIPLGGGCTLYVDPGLILAVGFMPNGAGFASIPVPLPATTTLGLGLVAQAGSIDPAGPFGLAFTNGLQLTIGE